MSGIGKRPAGEPLNKRFGATISSLMAGGHQTVAIALGSAHKGWRLDRALADAVPSVSRERLKTLIRSGQVSCGDTPLRDPAAKVRGDEAIGWSSRSPSPRTTSRRTSRWKSCSRTRICWCRKARRAGGSPRGRQFRRNVGQRLAAPLRRIVVGHRRGRPAGNRPPHRQGHVGAARGRQDRRRPRGLARQFAAHASSAVISRSSRGPEDRARHRRCTACPILRQPQEDGDRPRREASARSRTGSG